MADRPPAPRPSEGNRHTGQQQPNRRNLMTRNRAGSTGSTRGAFGGGGGVDPNHGGQPWGNNEVPSVEPGVPITHVSVEGEKRKKKKKKTRGHQEGEGSPKKSPMKSPSKSPRVANAAAVDNGLDLADINAMAMADITSGTNGGATLVKHRPLPPHPNARPSDVRRPPQAPGTKSRTAGGANKSIPRPGMAKRVSSFGPAVGPEHTNVNVAAEDEIQAFSNLAAGGYGATGNNRPQEQDEEEHVVDRVLKTEPEIERYGLWEKIVDMVWGPTHPQSRDMKHEDEEGEGSQVYDDDATWEPDYDSLPPLRRLITFLFYDPYNPEFSSTQQFSWACILGVFFGVLTAYWGFVIEFCVEVMWEKVPEILLEWGVFTDLDGRFPLPHYMWLCPAVCGGILAWISVMIPKPIPDQNKWIISLHRYGVMEHDTFVNLILIATGGMASGLSLGPELPLVLSSGMVGSYLGKITHQSILSARVMNLTAGAAAIGGFFGFPMAGALFVLELPHQMGLQYFEALSPATIASIIAVLVNRMVTGNDIKGYFNYPFLTASLPSHIFYIAILYGLVGSVLGIIYAEGVKFIKTWTHDWFHYHDHGHDDHGHEDDHKGEETVPLVGKADVVMHVPPKPSMGQRIKDCFCGITSLYIKHEPTRAAVVGVLAGGLTGLICMFLPHQLFWGEAQLQTLIDNGYTPLPVFGEGDEPTAALTAYGYCMIDAEDEEARREGFSTLCMGMICFTKIITIGLSIGTGIIGGHFWGPLYVAAAGSRFFIDLMMIVHSKLGFGEVLYSYPCVAILCIMASTHVVTFRTHMAIMLILTLTISAFTPEEYSGETPQNMGGDYSAVFPLLVVSCFVSLMVTRAHIFYKQQRCRGDIIASPEVLCEPGKEGQVEVPYHEGYDDSDGSFRSYQSESEEDSYYGTEEDDDANKDGAEMAVRSRTLTPEPTADDIEREFEERQRQQKENGFTPKGSARLDELLRQGTPDGSKGGTRHIRKGSNASRGRADSGGGSMRNVNSFGEIQFQDNLLEQARKRAGSISRAGGPPRPGGRHSRSNSNASASMARAGAAPSGEAAGALSQEDLERSFGSALNQMSLEGAMRRR
mmetsp:Transcript_6609/g.13864  ORF Transcript_6609/g.13864 Transcript_6609/m.13864 type:complete len:1095 (-) Transcript_6609:70-3354(-)